jgi:cobalt-zinc-cadmium efflux system outer membrane protein
MASQYRLSFICLIIMLQLGVVNCAPEAAAESEPQAYTLNTIVDLALARNPLVSSAEGHIDQQRGQQTAAGAYPNPSVTGNMGYGEIRDTGRANIRESLDRESLTEYNLTVGQPLEWPALRAARQRVGHSDSRLIRNPPEPGDTGQGGVL